MLVFCWQLLTVHYNYQGHWNALFCTGDRLPVPEQLSNEHIYLFHNTYGYDGEYYHLIAHDPFFQRGLARYIDAPRFRYHRILVPLIAYLIALGRSDWIDAAYFGEVLLTIFWGAYWLSLYCLRVGMSPVWGFAFLMLPATLVSIDRMTVDLALAALCMGFALFVERSPAAVYAILTAAPLVRDSGFLLIAAYVSYLLWQRHFRSVILYSTAAIPALVWYVYVQFHTPSYSVELFNPIPLVGMVQRILHPVEYPFAFIVNAVATILDYVALAGTALALLLSVKIAMLRRTGSVEFSIYVFALMVTFVSAREAWLDAYAFARGFSPLLLFLGLFGFSKRSWIYSAPLLLSVPRVALQLMPQALKIVTSLT